MEDILKCPECGGDNLHQYAARIFHFGTVVSQTVEFVDPVIRIDKNEDGNPSLRRNGIRIGFWCEEYCEVPDLAIYQHKGITFMKWLEDTCFYKENDIGSVEMKWEE